MVQAFSQKPLLEEQFVALPYDATNDMRQLLSSNSAERARAAESLKRSGDEKTARHLENLLLTGALPPEVRSDARNVLLALSSKYREYLLDMKARVRRTKALAIPATTRTRTPPRGVRALKL